MMPQTNLIPTDANPLHQASRTISAPRPLQTKIHHLPVQEIFFSSFKTSHSISPLIHRTSSLIVPMHRLLSVIILTLGLIVWSPASTIAWTLPEGQGLFIGTLTLKDLSQEYSGSGRRINGPDNTVLEFSPYIAYGVTPWLTSIVQPRIQLGWGEQPTQFGLDSTDFGARVRLWHNTQNVLSVQGLLRLPATQSRFGDPGLGSDWRVIYGRNTFYGTIPGFFTAEAGYRQYTNRPNEWRGDFTFGLRPTDRWMLLAQSFNLIQDGSSGWQSKIQFSVVRDLTSNFSLQIGTYTTLAGRNYNAETGGLIALWYRF